MDGSNRARLEIIPDIDEAAAEFAELRRLSDQYGFDLSGALSSLADSGTPVWAADVDTVAAPAANYCIARYKLAERLKGALAALRVIAGNGDRHLVESVVSQDFPPCEITPEMIEAGYKAARLYDREDPKEWEMAAIYRAMGAARH